MTLLWFDYFELLLWFVLPTQSTWLCIFVSEEGAFGLASGHLHSYFQVWFALELSRHSFILSFSICVELLDVLTYQLLDVHKFQTNLEFSKID